MRVVGRLTHCLMSLVKTTCDLSGNEKKVRVAGSTRKY